MEESLLDLKLAKTRMMMKNGQKIEALGLLQAMLPEAKMNTSMCPTLLGITMLQTVDALCGLDRYQEAYDMATELVAYAKAKFGQEHPLTQQAVSTYAMACAKLGRVEEAKATFEDALRNLTRVLGREHPLTQCIWEKMRFYGFGEG